MDFRGLLADFGTTNFAADAVKIADTITVIEYSALRKWLALKTLAGLARLEKSLLTLSRELYKLLVPNVTGECGWEKSFNCGGLLIQVPL